MDNYSLAQENIFRLLKEGKGEIDRKDWFFNAIEMAASKIGKRRGASIDIDLRRTTEAQFDWLNDLDALIRDKRIPNSENPCNIKHAAFLCYWLRRRQIVRDIQGNGISDDHLRYFPNEFVAARISMFLLFVSEYSRDPKTNDDVLKQLDGRFPEEFFRDFVVMLRYKNVSPHGIYLAFKALVTNVIPIAGTTPSIVAKDAG